VYWTLLKGRVSLEIWYHLLTREVFPLQPYGVVRVGYTIKDVSFHYLALIPKHRRQAHLRCESLVEPFVKSDRILL
jgi:hypothetical protein